MMDTFTYHNIFQEVTFRFVPVTELKVSEMRSQFEEIQRIALLLRIGGDKLFVPTRKDIQKLKSYLQALTYRMEYFELKKVREKVSKIFNNFNETASELTKFECDYFHGEIHAEALEEMSRRFRRKIDL